MKNVPEHVHQLYEHGEECLQEVLAILNNWPQPHGEYGRRLDFWTRTSPDQQQILKALEKLKTWVEDLAIQRALHDQLKLTELTTIVKLALTDNETYNQNAIEDAQRVRKEFLELVESMPIVNRAGNKSCACLLDERPVVRRQSRPRPRAYRHSNPKWQRKA